MTPVPSDEQIASAMRAANDIAADVRAGDPLTWIYESDVGWAIDLAATALWQAFEVRRLRTEIERNENVSKALAASHAQLRKEIDMLRSRLSANPVPCSCQAEIGDSQCARHPTCSACGVVKPSLDAACPECDGYGNPR